MKLLFFSDVHGSPDSLALLEKQIELFQPERLILLGDALYHGPRNALPGDYSTSAVAAWLNRYKSRITAVRGNCDSEVDQMMLEFPILSDSAIICWENLIIYACHGHHEIPLLQEGNVVLSGHTHIPADYEKDGVRYLNPGSASIPKENSWHGYMVLESGVFTWKNFEGEKQNV